MEHQTTMRSKDAPSSGQLYRAACSCGVEAKLWYSSPPAADRGLERAHAAAGGAHVGHLSRLGGTWWCDTCNSPYCENA